MTLTITSYEATCDSEYCCSAWFQSGISCSSFVMDAESKSGNCDAWAATGPDGVLSPHKI